MTRPGIRGLKTASALCLALAIGFSAQAAEPPRKLTFTLADHLEMPLTADFQVTDTRSQYARLNFLREEPGGNRLFVNDQSGPLYIVDKRSKQISPYLNLNGAAGRSGLFGRFIADSSFAAGFITFQFDPDYQRNGVFYTVHLEDAASSAPLAPKAGVVAGLDVAGFSPTPAIVTPSGTQPITREAVLLEWTDRNPADTTFQGTMREVLRVQLLNGVHPLGDLTFNPAARRGDAEWRVMYFSVGDSGTGETNDVRRFNPQRLDTFGGKIMRIVPDLREHVSTSSVSDNGRYRIPNDNPFAATPGARKEIWAYGMRNPHRLGWDAAPGGSAAPNLLAFVIGSNSGAPRNETVDIIRRGANFGYPLREGSENKPLSELFGPLPADNTLPLRISDTNVLSQRVALQFPVLEYKTAVDGNNAIAGGFVYRGRMFPQLQGSLIFGDITSGRIFYARMADLYAANDNDPKTMAPLSEITVNLRGLVQDKVRARAPSQGAPTSAPANGAGRIDLRLATDADGEIYVITKSDAMIRRVIRVE